MKNLINCILCVVLALFFMGCTKAGIPVTTEIFDSAGKVMSKTTTTIADANAAKHLGLYQMTTDIEREYTKQNKLAGFSSEVTGLEQVTVNGSPAILVKTKVTYKPTIARNEKVPTKIPDHWAKEVSIQGLKTILWMFGLDRGADVLTSLASGVGGLTINGSNNTVQGNQNKVGGTQTVRSEYVTETTETITN